MGCEFHRLGVENKLTSLPILDTCTEKTAFMCQIPGGRGGKFKLPTLTELHTHLFGAGFGEAHNATADVEATTRCFLELIRLREFTKEQLDVDASYFKNFSEANPKPIQLIGLKHINLKKESDKIRKRLEKLKNTATTKSTSDGLAALERCTVFTFTQSYAIFGIAIYHANWQYCKSCCKRQYASSCYDRYCEI